jgi:hypothetical protein
MSSLTLLNINDLPWSISVTWTLCRVEDLESFSPVMYHLHTVRTGYMTTGKGEERLNMMRLQQEEGNLPGKGEERLLPLS